MSQASPSASIAGPLQQAMESTGVNNQVALDGGLMNQSVVLLGRLLRSNSGSDCLEPALVFGEIPQARHNTVFSSHRVHLSASSAASRSSSCVREHLPFCRISTPNIIRTASSRSNSVSLACLMIPAHLNQVSRTSSRNRTKRVPPNSDFGLWGRSCIGKLAKLCKVDNFANITTLWILSEPVCSRRW